MITDALRANGEKKIAKSFDIEEIYNKYADMIYRVSFSYLKNTADAEDIVSDVFVKLIKTNIKFKSAEHEKAWVLRAAINLCKDNLKNRRRKCVDIDEHKNLQGENPFTHDDVLKSIMELPSRYETAVYLYYYEGYKTKEISKIMKKPHSSVRVYLHEAKKILKEVLQNEE